MLLRRDGYIPDFCKKTAVLCAIHLLCWLPSAAGIAGVPFSRSNGQILLNVVVENSSKTFLFDTGAPCCLFLDNIADTINYKILRKTFVIDGYGNRKSTWLTKIKEIRIGDQTVKDEFIILLEANPVLKSQKITGIIGHNIINQFDWRFNFRSNEAEIKNKIRQDDLSAYKVINTFLVNNSPYTVISAGEGSGLKDTCLVDFGDNEFISIRRLYKLPGQSLFSKIHSTSTASAVQKQDTSFIHTGKVKFNDGFCLDGLPLFTEVGAMKNAIGCSFFMMFDEIVVQSSRSRILVKNKPDLKISLKKYACFFGDNILTSYILKRNETSPVNIGDNAAEKNIPVSETIDFTVTACQ